MRSAAVRSVHREKISAKRAIELIRGAGGIPVLAHPMKISHLTKNENDNFFEELERQLLKLKSWGLAGMECYYSGHQPADTERLTALANKHGLIITAGSDFHGEEFDKSIAIGGFSTDVNFDEKRMILEIRSIFC